MLKQMKQLMLIIMISMAICTVGSADESLPPFVASPPYRSRANANDQSLDDYFAPSYIAANGTTIFMTYYQNDVKNHRVAKLTRLIKLKPWLITL
jgi:hypothetical protein